MTVDTTGAAVVEVDVLDANPYPGPASVTRRDRFFGREREIGDLTDLLVAERLVLLQGESGTGKTSLLEAGLYPHLGTHYPEVGRLPLVRVGSPPAEDGNRYLLSAVHSLLGPDADLAGLAEPKGARPASRYASPELAEVVLGFEAAVQAAERDRGSGYTLLVFDQFEEILTTDPFDRAGIAAFMLAVGEALRHEHRWAIFSIREEYVARLQRYRHLIPGRLQIAYPLERLTVEGARKAIVRPASEAGGSVSDGAVQTLLEELPLARVQQQDGSFEMETGDFVEPMHLQIVCRLLWDRTGGHIDEEAVQALDDEFPQGRAVDAALELYYKKEIDELVADPGVDVGEHALRDWFGEQLVKNGRRVKVLEGPGGEPPSADDPLIARILASRLVRQESGAAGREFELAHDRLITPIQMANARWRSARRDDLGRAADTWNAYGRPDQLLLRGRALRRAKQTAERRKLDKVEQKYLDRSSERSRRKLVVGLFLMTAVGAVATVGLFVGYEERLDDAENRLDATRDALLDTIDERSAAVAEAMAAAQQAEVASSAADESAAMFAMAVSARQAELVRFQALRESLASRDPDVPLLLGRVAADLATGNDAESDALELLHELINKARGERAFGTEPATAAVLAKDGRFVYAGYGDGSVAQWDVVTGVEHRRLRGAGLQATPSPVAALAEVGPSEVVAVAADGAIRRWNAASGEVAISRAARSDEVVAVAIDPAAGLVALADRPADGGPGSVRLWAIEARQEVGAMAVTHEEVGLAFGPGDGRMLVASGDGSTTAYGVNGPFAAAGSATRPERSLPIALRPSEGGGYEVFVGSSDHRIFVWDQEGSSLGTLEAGSAPNHAIVVDAAANRLFAIDAELTARVWAIDDPGGYAMTQEFDVGGAVADAGITATGDRLLVAREGAPPALWDTRIAGHHAAISAVARHGDTVVTAGRDGLILRWDPAGNLEAQIGAHPGAVSDLVLTDDGVFAVSAGDETVRVWDVEAGGSVGPVLASSSPTALAIHGDSVAIGSESGLITLWLLGDSEPDKVWLAHDRRATRSLAFSADGSLLASGGDDGVIKVWSVDRASRLATLKQHRGAVLDVAFGPDGRLASAGADGTARVWEPGVAGWSDDAGSFAAGDHFAEVQAVSWIDGGVLVTASADPLTAVQLWDLDEGARLLGIPHAIRPSGVAVDAERQEVVAAGSMLGEAARPYVSSWDIGVVLDRATTIVGRDLTGAECARYRLNPCPRYAFDGVGGTR